MAVVLVMLPIRYVPIRVITRDVALQLSEVGENELAERTMVVLAHGPSVAPSHAR